MRKIKYIYQNSEWPEYKWSKNDITDLLAEVRNRQGRLIGRMEALGFNLQNEAFLATLTSDIIKSTEIEGVLLNENTVRSSVAKRLGIEIGGLSETSRDIDGIVDMMFDATGNYKKLLTKERLFDWHCALFPSGRSGMHRISVGNWRDDSNGPMQVVSGAIGRETIHFQAPPAENIDQEIDLFLDWFNKKISTDYVIKAAIAHLWFVTIHPFDDGNGRIARAITDLLLARSDSCSQRFYSMSTQIQKERSAYYKILEKTQKGTLDITEWILWFLNALLKAVNNSETTLTSVIRKHKFWTMYAEQIKNDRQKIILNKLLDGFNGNLTSSKWAKITKCSQDTALRDIQDLITKGILKKAASGGRSTHYIIK